MRVWRHFPLARVAGIGPAPHHDRGAAPAVPFARQVIAHAISAAVHAAAINPIDFAALYRDKREELLKQTGGASIRRRQARAELRSNGSSPFLQLPLSSFSPTKSWMVDQVRP